MSTLSASFRKIRSKLNDRLMTRSNSGFFSNQVDASKINDLIRLGYKLLLYFIHVLLICKFQEDPIKTERVLFKQSLMCNSMINDQILSSFWTCQKFHPSPPYLQDSGSSDQTSYTHEEVKQRLFRQSRESNSKINESNQGKVTLMIQSDQV